MKILLVHNFYKQHGGENNYVNSLQRLLIQKKIDVVTYFKKSKNINNNLLDKAKVAIDMLHNPKFENELNELLDTEKPDLCHIHNLYPLIPTSIYTLLRKYKIPIVQTIHTYRLLCPKGFLYRNSKICEACVNKKIKYPSVLHHCYHDSTAASLFFLLSNNQQKIQEIIKNVDMFIFPAKFTKDYHLRFLAINHKKSAVLPYFVTKPKYTSNTNKKNYFLFVGRLSEEKGILNLIKMFNEIGNQKLIVIGKGPLYKKALKNTASNIKFLGELNKNKIYRFMSEAIATIIPSPWYEVGPIVLMESFANNTPVIAPKIGVFKERIKDNRTGFFYQDMDSLNLQETINKASLFKINKAGYQEMCKRVYQTYLKEYSSEKHFHSIRKIYAQAINKSSKQ